MVGITLDLDGVLGYCPQAAAIIAGANIAQMMNPAGQVVTADSASVSFTVYTVQSSPTSLPTEFPDLTDCQTAACWPMVSSVWLLLDVYAAPRGCEVRVATINFLVWFLTNKQVVTEFLSDDYAIVKTPPLLLDRFHVIDALTAITCNGDPVTDVVEETIPDFLAPSRLLLNLDSVVYFHELVPMSSDFEFTAIDGRRGDAGRPRH